MMRTLILTIVLTFVSVSMYGQEKSYGIIKGDDSKADTTRHIGKQTLVVTPVKDIPGVFATEKLNPDGGVVVQFSRGDGKFAFDAGAEPWYQTALLLRQYYAPFGTYGDKQNYVAGWKLIPVGESDTVEARFAMGHTDASNVMFVLKDGTGIAARFDGDKWTMTLPSVRSGETYEVYALYEGKNRQYTVGKLNVVSYQKQQHTVTLVPVDAQLSDANGLERELNSIYNPYGITISVGVDESIYDNIDWDGDGDGKLNLNGSGFFSNETGEMKALRKIHQQTSGYKKDSYYIFVMQEAVAGDEPDQRFAVMGDMPRSKQFGYIFLANSGTETKSLGRLAAHELGHGMFTLQHSFDVNYSGDDYKTKTTNLMDYSSGADLAAFQWNVMANPAPLTWFDSDEDAMSHVILINEFIEWIKSNKEKTVVDYKRAQFFNYSAWVDVAVYASINNSKIPLYVTLEKNGDINLKHPVFEIKAKDKFHSTFSLVLNYSGGEKEAFRIWTYNYEDFALLLKELGYSISADQKQKLIAEYKQLLTEAESDCNKLDVLYENIPDFVAQAIDDNEMLFRHLGIINSCAISNTSWIAGSAYDTNEQKAVLSIVGALDRQWLLNKLTSDSSALQTIEEVLCKLEYEYAVPLLVILREIAEEEVWSKKEYNDTPFVLLTRLYDDANFYQEYESLLSSDLSHVGIISGNYMTIPYYTNTLGHYEFGYTYQTGDISIDLQNKNSRKIHKLPSCGVLDPVLIEVEGVIQLDAWPAIAAKYFLVKRDKDKGQAYIELGVDVALSLAPLLKIGKATKFVNKSTSYAKYSKAKHLISVQRRVITEGLDVLNGVPAFRVSKGVNNSKVVVIGRNMDDVRLYKKGLEAKGFKVEIFDGEVIPDAAKKEWTKLTDGRRLTDLEILSTDMYKANKEWIERMVKEGYDIYDIGNLRSLAGDGLQSGWYSAFYEMEMIVVFP